MDTGFALDTADTFALTLAFLRADTTADSRKCAGCTADNLDKPLQNRPSLYLFHETREY